MHHKGVPWRNLICQLLSGVPGSWPCPSRVTCSIADRSWLLCYPTLAQNTLRAFPQVTWMYMVPVTREVLGTLPPVHKIFMQATSRCYLRNRHQVLSLEGEMRISRRILAASRSPLLRTLFNLFLCFWQHNLRLGKHTLWLAANMVELIRNGNS